VGLAATPATHALCRHHHSRCARVLAAATAGRCCRRRHRHCHRHAHAAEPTKYNNWDRGVWRSDVQTAGRAALDLRQFLESVDLDLHLGAGSALLVKIRGEHLDQFLQPAVIGSC